jgi:uncharacterized membrane protein/Mg-chelatase subunit ChlD
MSNFGLNFGISFDRPYYLLLLLIAPAIWILSYQSLTGLGRVRRFLALLLRTVVLTAIVVALAEIQWVKTSDRTSVIYLLDQSESIPSGLRQQMVQYVAKDVATNINEAKGDRAGIIVFGREANIEIPPLEDVREIKALKSLESYLELRTDATNLASALKLAAASFAEDSAKRIVLISDGNENLGDAKTLAHSLQGSGIGIDVVPVMLASRNEVSVEKIHVPSEARQGQATEVRVVLNNFATEQAEGGGAVTGRLKFSRLVGTAESPLDEQEVTLQPGKNVFTFKDKLDQTGVFTYRAEFVPNDVKADVMIQNNSATALTRIRGRGKVLFIVDAEHPDNFDYLIDRLKTQQMDIEKRLTNQLFTSLAELQGYDTVVLANTPRTGGADEESLNTFSDEQIDMLVRNTEQMGCGLVMIGGEDSFGAGGWQNTELEKAMPVDFQIKNAKVQAVGALVLMFHASEMAQGNYWQKVIGRTAVKAVGPMDYCGCIHWTDFGSGDKWLWADPKGLEQALGNRNKWVSRIDRMTPGDMPDFEPGMKKALAGFNRTKASMKMMIVISDGDPQKPSQSILQQYKKANIVITTVGVGTHGAPQDTQLRDIANATGGKYYSVKNPKRLPEIYIREARKISRPLVFEDSKGIQPQVVYKHEILDGIEGGFPPITGFVLTTVKENPLVEVAMLSPKPEDATNGTLLATWTYGIGRTAVLTTDGGNKWASDWTKWPHYDKFFSQLIRWSMRPIDEGGKFSVASEVKDGMLRVVITAFDKDDEFLNNLNMSASIVDPKLKAHELPVKQVAPGRYVGEFPADASGSYLATISPKMGVAPILAGVTVPYSAEFREHKTNIALLESLASLKPKGASSTGIYHEDGISNVDFQKSMKESPFRRDLPWARSSQDIWPLVALLCALIFFADVFIRRVAVGYDWIEPGVRWVRENVLKRKVEAPADDRMARLRSKKRQVAGEISEKMATARFDLAPEAPLPDAAAIEAALRGAGGDAESAPPRTPNSPSLGSGEAQEDDYTARLLKAKQKAKKDRGE